MCVRHSHLLCTVCIAPAKCWYWCLLFVSMLNEIVWLLFGRNILPANQLIIGLCEWVSALPCSLYLFRHSWFPIVMDCIVLYSRNFWPSNYAYQTSTLINHNFFTIDLIILINGLISVRYIRRHFIHFQVKSHTFKLVFICGILAYAWMNNFCVCDFFFE